MPASDALEGVPSKRSLKARRRRTLWEDARNLPNLLTFARILMIPLVLVLLDRGAPRDCFWAACVYALAAITDMLDGWLARRQGLVSVLGKFLDPLADKLLTCAALISLVRMDLVLPWMAMVIIGREFAVSGLRSIAAAEGYIIKASDLGKTKMITQVVAISMILVSIHWQALNGFAMLWMWGVVVFGIASAIEYFRKFWRKVDISIKHRRRKELLRIERQRKRMARTQPEPAAPKIGQAR